MEPPYILISQYDTGDKSEKKKKKKKPKEDEGTAWWEWCLIFAVLSYKIYTPLPEPIEDRYSRSVALFLNKAVYKGPIQTFSLQSFYIELDNFRREKV